MASVTAPDNRCNVFGCHFAHLEHILYIDRLSLCMLKESVGKRLQHFLFRFSKAI